MKRIAILQSNYIPWKGYFDLIAGVDEFIIYDDMQFTKNDWRNRNKIKTNKGTEWLSVPVGQNINRCIKDVLLPNNIWQKKHWKTLQQNYRKAPFFEEIEQWLMPLYLSETYTHLSQLNTCLIKSICQYLGIKTIISDSSNFTLINGKTERLVDLCIQAGGTEYVSGPSAKNYIDANLFAEQDIRLTWFDYSGYPEYPQLWGEFAANVTILDLLFNCGESAPHYMKFGMRNHDAF